jgi:hypothetical protein
LSETEGITTPKEANFLLFRFVKQHYKTLDCIIVYEFVGFEKTIHYSLFIPFAFKNRKKRRLIRVNSSEILFSRSWQ